MSKKEERKKLREEKKLAGKRREMRNAWLGKLGLVLLVPLVLYLVYQGFFAAAPVYSPAQIADSDHIRGNPEAELTITIYADFQCPACFTETQVIASAWSRISDQARIVFRHYPLDIHRHAFLAARYAEAAGKQGRFWEMHDFLYERQADWSGLANATLTFNDYALQLGLDMQQLQEDIGSEAVRAKIVADQQGGIRAGVRGTPVMFFDGRRVNNPRSSSELVEMVSRALTDKAA